MVTPSTKVFLKKVPCNIWTSQFQSHDEWNGEYVTDGENFVTEAAVLLFLQTYVFLPRIAPFLHAIVVEYEWGAPARYVLVSEFYGEDLLDHFNFSHERPPISPDRKKSLQHGIVKAVATLHNAGIAHLDLTPENILVGADGIRICDFAKSTPLQALYAYHERPSRGLHPFSSCEPTVGKGAYMPPECWHIVHRMRKAGLSQPFRQLQGMPVDRKRQFYFDVGKADMFMVGVLLFWIWSEGFVWKYSDPVKDEQFRNLVESDMNFDIFSNSQSWPFLLKKLLKDVLEVDPNRRIGLTDVVHQQWWRPCE